MLQNLRENLADKVRVENFLIREFFAEFIGTFFFLVIYLLFNFNKIVYYLLNYYRKIITNITILI